ncbi:hypothetical protein V2H45_03115 [Tumidithrix elongata RA019]|uniref:Uncharacterized protein n=2 Tax=Tumidithrix TaxID=3088355 RepID=A0AAW9PXZ0_9CYAN|nr:hypothetical protein [Tumidithrix elongata RA019]
MLDQTENKITNDIFTIADTNGSALPFMQPESFDLQLPDPEDEQIADHEFHESLDRAWQVCDRFDLQTDIWRGRILRSVRDREKINGDSRGSGFLQWLQEREISKSQAYAWITLANSADTLVDGGFLEADDVKQFSKRAFVETAQASPEVQQLVSEAARNGDRITRREVRQLSDEWTAMSSELLPIEVREKVSEHTIPSRYVAPLVRELEKLPEAHQDSIKYAIAENSDIDNIRQVTAEAQRLSKYLSTSTQVQALSQDVNLELALEEALRIGCLKSTADLVSNAAQLEQTIAKLYTTWKRLTSLAEQVYTESGASTPHLRSLLSNLESLSSNHLEVQLGVESSARLISLHIQDDAIEEDSASDRDYA